MELRQLADGVVQRDVQVLHGTDLPRFGTGLAIAGLDRHIALDVELAPRPLRDDVLA
jgi:hypothetical protein